MRFHTRATYVRGGSFPRNCELSVIDASQSSVNAESDPPLCSLASFRDQYSVNVSPRESTRFLAACILDLFEYRSFSYFHLVINLKSVLVTATTFAGEKTAPPTISKRFSRATKVPWYQHIPSVSSAPFFTFLSPFSLEFRHSQLR